MRVQKGKKDKRYIFFLSLNALCLFRQSTGKQCYYGGKNHLKHLYFSHLYFKDNERTVYRKGIFSPHTKFAPGFPTLQYSLLLQFLNRTPSDSRRLTAEFE